MERQEIPFPGNPGLSISLPLYSFSVLLSLILLSDGGAVSASSPNSAFGSFASWEGNKHTETRMPDHRTGDHCGPLLSPMRTPKGSLFSAAMEKCPAPLKGTTLFDPGDPFWVRRWMG